MRHLTSKKVVFHLVLHLMLLTAPAITMASPDSPAEDRLGVPERQRKAGFDRERFNPEQLREKLMQKLNLNAPQKKAMQQFRNGREQLVEIGLDLKDKRDKINLMLKDQSSSEQDIRRELAELNQLMAELNQKRVENLLTLRKSLEPEQFKKVLRFMDAAQKRRGPGDEGPDHEAPARSQGFGG